jgi:hypothetical protein
MADVKISGLPASTTPLAGSEVLPIVQGGQTKQVSVTNLTAGRSVSATSFVPSSSTIPTNGVYLPAVNSVGVATNSTNALYINATQNVGVNTAVIPTTFCTYGAIANVGGTSSSAFTGTASIVNASAASAAAGTHGSSLVFAQSWTSGGPTSVIATGQITGVKIANDGSFGGGLAFWTSNGAGTDLAERMRMFSSGGISIGDTTNPSAGNLRLGTGNLVIGTSGKGIDFSATAGTGTSELLNDYEEGTWTPNVSTWSTLPTIDSAVYTKIGRVVTLQIVGVSGACSGVNAKITNLPFTPNSLNASSGLAILDTIALGFYANMFSPSVIYLPTTSIAAGRYWTFSIDYIV